MKKTLLLFASLIFTLGFAGGDWDQCEKISYDTTVVEMAPGEYKFIVTVKNEHVSEEFPNDNNGLGFCHYGLLDTDEEITFIGDDQCVVPIPSFQSRDLEYNITLSDTTIQEVCINVKLKNTIDDNLYCEKDFCFSVNQWLSLDEVDLTNIPFTETYYDLLGRVVNAPVSNKVYVVKKVYANGHESVKKVYYAEI